MSTLVLEIGCEELPASACWEAEAQLPLLCRRHLGVEPAELYIGPRRLALLVRDLPDRSGDEDRRGPPERIAFDEQGKPTNAAEGFARGLGLGVEQLERRDGYVWARVEGQPLTASLPDRFGEIVHGLVFSKSMRWDESGLRFARPIRWLCVKVDDRTVETTVGRLESGGFSYGHRFTNGVVAIPEAEAYAAVLRDAGVEPEAPERRRAIVEALDRLGEWRDPQRVLDEVVHMVEQPLVLEGSYHDRFLELPLEVVETVMQSHQRYFPLGPGRFAFVANGGEPEVVVSGNEAVLEGRLEDAAFSYGRDVEIGIEAMASRLPEITFHARAGSLADKAARLAELCRLLGGGEATVEAARLAKADQTSTMVHEFPELEGLMGGVYARLAGSPEAVAAAIAEHYRPDAAGGPLPETAGGRVLAAADKLDNLTVAFALDERPTGSRDPFGLRRAAIGLCRLADEGGLAVDVRSLVERDRGLLVEQGADVTSDPSDVEDFVLERLEGLLDVPVEVVRAARAGEVSDLGAIARLARALAAALASDAFEHAYVAHDRAGRLAGRSEEAAASFDPRLAVEPAELALVEALTAVAPRIGAAVEAGAYEEALEAAAELGPPVDRFFDEVLVMAEDSAVRANRLRLLLDVRDAAGQLGDLSQIPR